MIGVLCLFGIFRRWVFPPSFLVVLLDCFSVFSVSFFYVGGKSGCLCFGVLVSLGFCWVVDD